MAERSPITRESHRGGCHCSRYARNRGTKSKQKEVEEIQGMGSVEVNLAERCYNTKNLTVERRTLSHLECELDVAFRFEQGGGQGTSPVWVTRILLGRLLRERMALGRAIKMFAKFQRREIMHCMVKLNDLEELAKPPLGGAPIALTSAPMQEEEIYLDDEARRRTTVNNTAQFSPEDENFGLV